MALRATDLIEKSCLACNAIFKTQYRNIRRERGKFCSKRCSNSYLENRISKRNKQIDTGTKDTYRKYFGKNEHRIVMEKVLGRKLLREEVVHHIDGNKKNNNPNNLKLYSRNADHLRDHLKTNIGNCVVEGCNKDQKIKNMCFMHYERFKKQTIKINLGDKK